MKKLLLLSLAIAGAASIASAQDEYKWGGVQNFKPGEGYNLTLEWACLDYVGAGDKCRQGTGANDKFYLSEFGTKNVHVYGPKGFEQTLTMPDYCWVTNTGDDAGHILIRTCELVWPAHAVPMYPGCYYATDGHKMQIINSENDQIIGVVPMPDGYDGRFDAIGHIRGNVAEDYWELTAVGDGNQFQGYDWMYDALEYQGFEGFVVKVQPPFANTGAGACKTTGTCQLINPAEDGTPLMAMYPNPVYNITGSSLSIDRGPADGEKEKVTLGNGIMLYQYSWVGDEEDGADMWNFAGKYFVTPQHASNNGFVVFELGGKEYIVYTSGESGGAIAADALAISEVRYTDTPESDDEMDKGALVYRLFPSIPEGGAGFNYKASSFYTNINIERIADDENSIYIYVYTGQAPMLKLKFTAPTIEGGVEGVTVADAEGEAEFFNLQGIRVANPENGVYIMRQGNKTSKIIR